MRFHKACHKNRGIGDMGVKVIERKAASGDIAFSIDVYHKDFGRFRQSTGLKASQKDRKAYAKAKAETEEQRRQIEKQLERDPAGTFSRKARQTDDFLDYYRSYAEKGRHSVFMNVIPILQRFTGGKLLFSELNSIWLERFKAHLLTIETISQNTATDYLRSVKTVIRAAWRLGYIEQDFTGKVSGIKKVAIETEFLQVEQLKALHRAECSNEMIKQAFFFGCFTGLRISDIEALTWQKVSLVNGVPYIRFQQVKTGQYENYPLTADAVKVLQAVRGIYAEFAPEGSDSVFILPSRSRLGQILHVWGLSAGLKFRLHFHVSRHTFATSALTAGVDHYTVSKLLGHTDIGTTQRYIRLVDSKRLAAVQSLPDVLQSFPADQAVFPAPPAAAGTGKSTLSKALEVKGQKIAAALSLPRDDDGRYLFDGQRYTAVELAIEVQ